jgi:hypothetical protein
MAQTVVSTSQVWRPLKIGGGGFITKIASAADGTLITRTDTYGGYIRRPGDTSWTQFKTAASMPSGDVYYASGTSGTSSGTYDVAIADTNNDIMYMVSDERPYKSTNGGATWVEISNGFATQADSQMDANAQDGYSARLCSPFMAVDPINADVVYLGNGKRLYRTLDGGANWAACSGISDANGNNYPGVAAVLVDPSSSTTSGRKSVVYCWVYGRGWYQSTNGGNSFSLMGIYAPCYPDNPLSTGSSEGAGGIWNPRDAAISADGVILVADQSDLWRYRAGAWTKHALDAVHLAIDPFDSNRAIILTNQDYLRECLNINAATMTWGSPVNSVTNINGMEQPWVALAGETTIPAAANFTFSKTEEDKLYFTGGTHCYEVNVPLNFTSVEWVVFTTGIENLVGTQVRKFSGNKHLYCSCYDRGLFVSGNPEAYATRSMPPINDNARGLPLKNGWCTAAPDSNSDTILSLMQAGDEDCRSGISYDQGKTWTALNLPPIWYILAPLNGANDFDIAATVSGSPTVTITSASHGLTAGVSYVTFVQATAFASVDLVGKRYLVASTPTANTFTITYATNASATVSAGGKNVRYTTYHESNKFSCVNGSGIVTAVLANQTEAFAVGGKITFYNTSSIGTLNLNGRQTILSVSGGTITFAPGGTANADVTNGGGSNFGYYADWNAGEIPPSTQVVCSTATNWVMVGGSGRLAPHYTTDAGVTWTACTFPSVLRDTGWSYSYYQQRNIIDSDPNTPGTFYAFHYDGGTYRSTDGGANWTLRNSADFLSHSPGNWHTNLTCVPGHAGHLFWSCGSLGSPPGTGVSGRAMFSTDGGTTWEFMGVTTLGGADPGATEIGEVNWLSIGAVKPGSSYPTIWISGWINNTYGIYYCTNASPTTTGKWTWNSVEAYPMGWMDFMTGMQADPEIWHTCYLSLAGSGYAYTTQTDVTKRTFEITT